MSDFKQSTLTYIMPNANVNKYFQHLADAMIEFEINSNQRVAAFLAQIAHESGELRYIEEIASGSAYDKRGDLGNTTKEAIEIAKKNNTTAGKFYKGHGFIQITGYYNHKACGEALGIDAVNKPMLLATPKEACRSAAWFWKKHGCNEMADRGDFLAITKRINGGTNGLEDRQKYYKRAKEVLTFY